jgi:phytanoyl-CoA hydroxylase
MKLTSDKLNKYREAGFLVLSDFVSASACDELRDRASELVNEFDPRDVVSIFSTKEQNRLSDDYFLTSGDKIRFFFEEDAFLADGSLKESKECSINKIGHS